MFFFNFYAFVEILFYFSLMFNFEEVTYYFRDSIFFFTAYYFLITEFKAVCLSFSLLRISRFFVVDSVSFLHAVFDGFVFVASLFVDGCLFAFVYAADLIFGFDDFSVRQFVVREDVHTFRHRDLEVQVDQVGLAVVAVLVAVRLVVVVLDRDQHTKSTLVDE